MSRDHIHHGEYEGDGLFVTICGLNQTVKIDKLLLNLLTNMFCILHSEFRKSDWLSTILRVHEVQRFQ